MLFKRIINIYSTAGGQVISDKVRQLFTGMSGVEIDGYGGSLPRGSIVVAAFILTTDSVNDLSFCQALNEWLQKGLPIVPIVPDDPRLFNFSGLPPDLAPLSERNVIGWKSSDPSVPDGEKVIENIKAWLGLALFKRDRKLFLSYRRADGLTVAKTAYDYFIQREYRVFMDTEDLAAGDRVQHLIHEAIFDRDFLLLIDSPDAASSKWIREELETAILNRIKIVVLRLPGGKISLPPEIAVINYRDATTLLYLEKMLQEYITVKCHFDLKVEDALSRLATTYGFQLTPEGTRKVLLTRKISPRKIHNVLLEFEDAYHSLESLYRLYYDFQDLRNKGLKIASAYFIHRGSNLSPYQKEAVQWAKRKDPLEIGSLDEFVTTIINSI